MEVCLEELRGGKDLMLEVLKGIASALVLAFQKLHGDNDTLCFKLIKRGFNLRTPGSVL